MMPPGPIWHTGDVWDHAELQRCQSRGQKLGGGVRATSRQIQQGCADHPRESQSPQSILMETVLRQKQEFVGSGTDHVCLLTHQFRHRVFSDRVGSEPRRGVSSRKMLVESSRAVAWVENQS